MCTFDSARPSRQISTRCSSSRKGPKSWSLVRSLPPRKITTTPLTSHLIFGIRAATINKRHIKVKISKAIIYQHEASKHWRSGELLRGRRLSKHHSCERNSWLDCMHICLSQGEMRGNGKICLGYFISWLYNTT